MALIRILIIIMVCPNFYQANEQYCRQFDYDEKLLTKMIRMEVAMETLTKRIEAFESEIETRMEALNGYIEDGDEIIQHSPGGRKPKTLLEKLDDLNSDMERRLVPVERQSRMEYVRDFDQRASRRIGFTVSSPARSVKGNVLRFKSVISNYGEGFDYKTGKFVCRMPGLYFFSATIMTRGDAVNPGYCYIYVGAASKTVAYAHTKHTGDFSSGSASLVYELEAGDEVYLGGCDNVKKFDVNTHFSGIHIK